MQQTQKHGCVWLPSVSCLTPFSQKVLKKMKQFSECLDYHHAKIRVIYLTYSNLASDWPMALQAMVENPYLSIIDLYRFTHGFCRWLKWSLFGEQVKVFIIAWNMYGLTFNKDMYLPFFIQVTNAMLIMNVGLFQCGVRRFRSRNISKARDQCVQFSVVLEFVSSATCKVIKQYAHSNTSLAVLSVRIYQYYIFSGTKTEPLAT